MNFLSPEWLDQELAKIRLKDIIFWTIFGTAVYLAVSQFDSLISCQCPPCYPQFNITSGTSIT